MPFEIVVHAGTPIIEVIYPSHPTALDLTDYAVRIKRAIRGVGPGWACLVDQRELKVMPPELYERVADLNTFAKGHGMRCSARIVSSAVAGLQAKRLAHAVQSVPVETFVSREEALAWLTRQLRGG